MRIDDASALKLAKNAEFHRPIKRIDIRHRYIREYVRDGTVSRFQILGKQKPVGLVMRPSHRLLRSG